jgi:hypothetical protein
MVLNAELKVVWSLTFSDWSVLTGSQIDVPIRDYDVYVNKMMEFKVVKINHEFKT